jgi:hypothetical protein
MALKEVVAHQGDLDDAAAELSAALGQCPPLDAPPSDWDDEASL